MSVSLQFQVKFTLTFFLFLVHVGLFILCSLALITGGGETVEGISIGFEAILLIMISIRLWYYHTRYRAMTNAQRMVRDGFDERVFLGAVWIISLANVTWLTTHAVHLPDDFGKLPNPDLAAIAAITLAWLGWTVSVHLVWLLVQEENAWFNAMAVVLEAPKQWPEPSAAATGAAGPFTTPPARRFPSDKCISAKIVAVQHGSPPELWAKKNFGNSRADGGLPAPSVQPAKPTYDPRARQFREPPPVKTSRYQWYITPGEAV